LKKDISF